ncbi:MAG: hypothetical protein KC441_19550 [Anaerolineales bacterium]|nr:hypothetical protein [Anaerolineales bacterium]
MTDEIFYKVSFVVMGGEHPGAIMTVEKKPEIGDEITFNGSVFRVTEVMELMPPVGNFGFLHATCEHLRPTRIEEGDETG